MITLRKPSPEPASTERARNWLRRAGSRQLNGWVIDLLRLQPYQHVLEIGFGTGRLLEETARTLRIGFLAGVEASVPLYQQAYRRNRQFIARQLTQLHLGELQDLPYPPHYFHTVYSTSPILHGKDAVVELRRLAHMLRSGGKLTLLHHQEKTRANAAGRTFAQQIQQDSIAAGLHSIHLEYRDTSFGVIVAATGFTH